MCTIYGNIRVCSPLYLWLKPDSNITYVLVLLSQISYLLHWTNLVIKTVVLLLHMTLQFVRSSIIIL